ncbi:iron ABC transporter [Photobacterium kishitanii]|uniref:Iron ABC transporter n=1 Tax=Photobacterium kishitanii TaxID=318456 RepID=A0AAX0YQK1_9GAMM|nr:ATP-binding cassette domain-containing protein [Photobacterium kishitanii]KJG08799.1 iron ABC transporter [Photobacterium kishitanii]KJG56189.1 iron ABC transporter [Photobacterium kishitanii]KJG59552.1 iron ABC transporter [Photobacterium kishitanii]KJG64317.1 iron ABC transporter [Photobacterium kishitanii]KJG68420.1 iron ABC transporter [Photobacterium kishitanii]
MIPPLTVNQLSYHQGSQPLLQNINFAINPGELVGIIGPNGAGKSTLLKCLSGYITPSHGSICLFEQPLNRYSHQQRAQRLSYLPQHTEPAFGFLVRDIIYYGHQQSTIVSKQEINNIINQLQINELLNRPINQLSGGEQQRVHFARLLIQNAAIMLLDEPTASLDIGHESLLLNILSHHCQQGKSALIAIHNLNTAITFCDRLLLLEHGQQIALDTPSKVLTPQQITALYHHHVSVTHHPDTQKLLILPQRHQII